MATQTPSIADLNRDPELVAAGLPAWQRGDVEEAVSQTLAVSARSAFTRSYTAWIWTGSDPSGAPAWILPILTSATEQFAPRGMMSVLTRCLRAATEAGAHPAQIGVVDWNGFTAVRLPGLEPLLAPVALSEAHPPPARVAIGRLTGTPIDGPALELAPLPRSITGGGLVAIAHATRVHPVPIALALCEQGWGLEEASYPSDLVGLLRHRGYSGPSERPEEPSFAIEDDACPRRRHARRVLRRLLHKRKIGAQYHTEFDHLARGAPQEDRADALQIGEALIRAGLLGEKPSVGQRHVFLRREALPAIHALIDRGETADPVLAAHWTAPAPADVRAA
jgi:hypothetical protein